MGRRGTEMADKAQQKTIIIRGVLTVFCIAGSFVFPLLFLVAAFLAWTIYSDLTDPKPTAPPADAWYIRRWTAIPDDPQCKTYFLPYCESPAEAAFLEAMIADYKLLPKTGMLVGPGIELNLQVKRKPYRVDFLVDKWLVVEIDGAAWHSSPEAVERDRIRDEFFVTDGFIVIRIPAKVVFNTPKRVVEMVRAAVARGAPPRKVVTASRPASVSADASPVTDMVLPPIWMSMRTLLPSAIARVSISAVTGSSASVFSSGQVSVSSSR